MTIDKQISTTLETLIVDLKRATLQSVEEALGLGPRNGTHRNGTTRNGHPVDQGRVLSHLKANPNQRLEEIAVALAVPSATLKAPIARILKDKAIRKRGAKRGTNYRAA